MPSNFRVRIERLSPRRMLAATLMLAATSAATGPLGASSAFGQTGSVAVISWQAPGDDGAIGTAARYEMRYRDTSVTSDTLGWWNGGTPVTGLPAPGAPGSTDSVVVSSLDPSVAYTFMLRVGDEVPNWSPFSNAVVKPAFPDVIPPAAIRDLDSPPGNLLTKSRADASAMREPRAAPPRE